VRAAALQGEIDVFGIFWHGGKEKHDRGLAGTRCTPRQQSRLGRERANGLAGSPNR
jgi:hypothetical protein